MSTVRGADAATNAARLRAVLGGEAADLDAASLAAARDVVSLNAGAALYLGARADSVGEGVAAARSILDDGAAASVLERFVSRSRELAS